MRCVITYSDHQSIQPYVAVHMHADYMWPLRFVLPHRSNNWLLHWLLHCLRRICGSNRLVHSMISGSNRLVHSMISGSNRLVHSMISGSNRLIHSMISVLVDR